MSLHDTGEAMADFAKALTDAAAKANIGLNEAFFAFEIAKMVEFRRAKAAQYPDDSRNEEAAALLERLFWQVSEMTPHDLSPLIAALGEYDLPQVEIVNGYLGRIGFDFFPATATEMVNRLTAKLGEDA